MLQAIHYGYSLSPPSPAHVAWPPMHEMREEMVTRYFRSAVSSMNGFLMADL